MRHRDTFFLLMLFLFSSTISSAQVLERGGSLGAMITISEDSSGVLVQQVIPNSTSESIGLQADDIILSVNNERVRNHMRVVEMTQSWRAGDKLDIVLNRKGEEVNLGGIVKGKPTERSKYGEVTYGAVPFDKGLLRSILITPNDVENPPVIFFLQGFSCSTIDFYYNDQSVIKQLVEGWVKEGIAVYRVEKPGVGDCKDLPNCEDIGYNYEVQAFQTALKYLKKNPAINPDEVYLFGHSLGGVTAPLLAAETPVKGVINYGSVAIPWYEYLLKVLREQEEHRNTPFDEIERETRLRAPLLFEYLVQKKSPAELEQNPVYKEIMSTGLPVRDGDRMIGRHYTFQQEINDANVTEAFKKANCYVLALHGEFDVHAVDYEWAEHTAKIVNSFHPGKGEWKIIPGTEHAFASVPSMEAYMQMRSSGAFTGTYMNEHFNPEVTKTVVDWIKSISNKQG